MMNNKYPYTEIIHTNLGPIKGIFRHNSRQYLGIPYAEPLNNQNAFKRAKKINKWIDVYIAEKGKTNFIQEISSSSIPNNDINSLYFNIFTPIDIDKPLPVMIYFHGGSYTVGGSGEIKEDQLEFELGYFANKTNTVVVSFNYRLNLFGFLNLNSVNKEFDINNGLYDQLLLLNVIKENISYFNGDINNITLFGQSAGAASIFALMTSPLSKGLFHKVILESPCLDHFFSYEKSSKYALEYLKILKIKPNDINKLKELNKEEIGKANIKFERKIILKKDMLSAFSPTIDKELLPDYPLNLIKDSPYPLLITMNDNECDLFIKNIKGFIPLFISRLYMGVKPINKKEKYRYKIADALTDKIFFKQLDELMDKYPKDKLYLYRYSYISNKAKKNNCRCTHTAEIGPLFNMDTLLNDVNDNNDRIIGDKLRKIFADFAYDKLVYNKEDNQIAKE